MPHIGQLVRQSKKPFISFEFFPPADPGQLDNFYQVTDALGAFNPLFISVTYGAGGSKQDRTLAVTAELARRGFTTMAHLTCVGANPDAINDFLHKLNDNNVQNILALRGDPPKDRAWNWEDGVFKHAGDLVKFVKTNMPHMGIGVAAYPAPHPESPTFSHDRQYTALKLISGADFAITQLFFDIREYVELVENLRGRGIDIPIIPGIMTIQSFESLRRVLSMCGANIPGNLYMDLEEANATGGKDALREAGIRFTIDQIHKLLDYGVPGIHLYTLNKSDLCSRIIRETGLDK